ncbi:MAG TPA: arginine decarboxylase, pyruvoyl-dependent [Elusimicrobiales bacterium]|nr:arginine decarboxylase, pyruvoyl-dependent [Elusimicrobiales bacterium]
MSDSFIPKEIFFTKGIGRHKEKLASFEEALRHAKLARFNLVPVSSIFPPQCKLVSASKGVERLKTGQILHVVISRNSTNESRRLLSASVGVSIPKDKNAYGYISEHHSFGQTDEQSGEYSEDLAASMLATTLGIEFDSNSSWDNKKEIWKLSGKIVKTMNVTQSAIGHHRLWTTVIAAAVFAR